mgnify:CR=1 FL=1
MAENVKTQIEEGKTALGIELGSTRIKAVLVDKDNNPVALGEHPWENSFKDGIWTYSVREVINGLQDCYAKMAANVKEKYGVDLTTVGAIGISAMMHGYMVFDKENNLLVPFRTWRNNNAAYAAERLTEEFGFHIPARWSVAHLYQAILNGEKHIENIAFQTTLGGYVHFLLTGRKVIGIGEASGMFPIDYEKKDFDDKMLARFDELVRGKVSFNLKDILPEILLAGENGGTLTEDGALLLDPTGKLRCGIPFCPPEGDAGTGMVATNSVRKRTGNVSAGTSVFAMIVLEKELSKVYPEIDIVTTPTGIPVGMVHCNNCTSDINAWVNVFEEFSSLLGTDISKNKLFEKLFTEAEKGEKDCGGLLTYNYVSNEHITRVEKGRPLFVRTTESKFSLQNFMRSLVYSAFGALKTGCDIMLKEEGVCLDRITGHGGIFKTERVGQSVLAAAINTPVSVMKTAGEGGAWGIALLANYMIQKKKNESLEDYLDEHVFKNSEGITLSPNPADVKGFEEYMTRYLNGLPVVREATRLL